MPNALEGLLGGMQATPRNKLMGLLADGLKAADRYANKPDPTMPGGKANPPLSLLSDLASLKSLAEVANNVSYGYPLTNKGVANVPFLKPETADALMMAPISPRNALAAAALAGGGDTAAMKAIFAGIGAKTADKAALARAEKLAASGADPKAIWRDTGWFKGGDGKWRFEIDDSEAVVPKYSKHVMRPLEEAMMHEPLEAAYPSVKNIIFETSPGGNLSGAEYRANVNFHKFGPRESLVIRNSEESANQNKSLALHELQHAIQQREGFSGGGNPANLREYADPQDAYWRLAGEAEARAVQQRRNLTAQQRRDLFPLDSYDVPINSLIYR